MRFLLATILLVALLAPTAAAQMNRAAFASDWRGGALLVGRDDVPVPDDALVAIWAENWSWTPPFRAHVMSAVSPDGGLSWGPTRTLFEHVYGIRAHAESADLAWAGADAAMDPEGIVHVLLIFGVWRGTGAGQFDPWGEVLYGQLNLVTGTLDNQRLLAEGAIDATHPRWSNASLCVGRLNPLGGGRYVHVLFGEDPSTAYDNGLMMYARSSDSGNSWTVPVNINPYFGMDTSVPCDITADGMGNVYIAYGPDWYSGAQPSAVYFRRSSNDGASWGAGSVLPGLAGAPSLLSNDANGVYCCFNAPGAVGCRWSYNNGATWWGPTTVATRNYPGHLSGPRIAMDWASPDEIHVVYSDYPSPSREEFEIYYARVSSAGTVTFPSLIMSVVGDPANQMDFGRSVVSRDPESVLVGCGQRFKMDWGNQIHGEPYTMLISGLTVTDVPGAGEGEQARAPVVSPAPNPTTHSANIYFRLDREQAVTVEAYDVNGRLVRNVARVLAAPGAHVIEWDGRGETGAPVASGVYLLRMTAGGSVSSHKVVIQR